MNREKTTEQLLEHKDASIQILQNYLTNLIENGADRDAAKADKLAYWISDWVRFLSAEPSFKPERLCRYKRGEIIKVHLGFNVGSEEGGLHYAVVIDNKNSVHDPTLRIVPLTSVKPHIDVSSLPSGKVYIGNELFVSLSSKLNSTKKRIAADIQPLIRLLDSKETLTQDQVEDLDAQARKLLLDDEAIAKMQKEISKMKSGSIALTSQITTISKIRIYDPRSSLDVLGGIKLSNEKLDLIDRDIMRRYLKSI